MTPVMIRVAAPVLLAALSFSSGGCAYLTMIVTGSCTLDPEHKGTYDTWGETMDWMGKPNPEGGPNILGGTLFTIFAAPWFLIETEAFLIELVIDFLHLLFVPGHDMYLTKRWCCWWSVLFGSRRFRHVS